MKYGLHTLSKYSVIGYEKYIPFSQKDNEDFDKWKEEYEREFKNKINDYVFQKNKKKFLSICKCGEINMINAFDYGDYEYYIIGENHCDKCNKILYHYSFSLDKKTSNKIEEKYNIKITWKN